MKKIPLTPQEIRRLEARYRMLSSRLGGFESLSQGSVMPQPPGAWRWTRKVCAKTLSVGLSPERALKMQRAIANHRELEKIIAEMREITQKLILQSPETLQVPKPAAHPKLPLT